VNQEKELFSMYLYLVFIPGIEKVLLPEIEDAEAIPVGRDQILIIDDEEIIATLQ